MVDTTVYITYAVYNKIHRLADAVITYRLNVFLNQYLIDELEKNLPAALKLPNLIASDTLSKIRSVTIFVKTTPHFTDSPEPKDNFLFDLALQTGSEVIVTQEKALLGFAASPVAIHDIKWFKETFPVPL